MGEDVLWTIFHVSTLLNWRTPHVSDRRTGPPLLLLSDLSEDLSALRALFGIQPANHTAVRSALCMHSAVRGSSVHWTALWSDQCRMAGFITLSPCVQHLGKREQETNHATSLGEQCHLQLGNLKLA